MAAPCCSSSGATFLSWRSCSSRHRAARWRRRRRAGSLVAIDVEQALGGVARDNLSGVTAINLIVTDHPTFGNVGFGAISPDQVALDLSGCQPAPGAGLGFSQFSPYDTYHLEVLVSDAVGNQRRYRSEVGGLCAIGPCEVVNGPGLIQEDGAADTVPDAVDNSPTVANPDQADADLDLIGDACDPFPTDRDNDQAQCEADLARCRSTWRSSRPT